MVEAITVKSLSYRWRYILLPVIILLLSIIIVAYFYRLLPGEIAYHFKDGSPDRWLSRSAIIVWMLIPQFLLALLAVAIVWGTIRLGARFWQAENTAIKKVLSLMGNMVALPQIILGFAMLNIFSYNSYQTHIMPWWVFALIAMVGGGIILGIFFLLVIRQVRQPQVRSFKERE